MDGNEARRGLAVGVSRCVPECCALVCFVLSCWVGWVEVGLEGLFLFFGFGVGFGVGF